MRHSWDCFWKRCQHTYLQHYQPQDKGVKEGRKRRQKSSGTSRRKGSAEKTGMPKQR